MKNNICTEGFVRILTSQFICENICCSHGFQWKVWWTFHQILIFWSNACKKNSRNHLVIPLRVFTFVFTTLIEIQYIVYFLLNFKLSPDWQIDYESYSWKKLDANAAETKKLVTEYFAWEGDFGGKKFNQGKIFKWNGQGLLKSKLVWEVNFVSFFFLLHRQERRGGTWM